MSELRASPTSRAWTIIASERGKRPHDFRIEKERSERQKVCPFCYGNESMTPPELLAVGRTEQHPDTPGWTVRVVPNKFPALAPQGGEIMTSHADNGLYEQLPGIGRHEVVIESPDHDATWGSYDEVQMSSILEAVLMRMEHLKKDRRLKYFQFFKNAGSIAGASLSHAHSQIVVTPNLPATVAEELDVAKEHYARSRSCVYCDIIEEERRLGKRIVAESPGFVALAPYASRFPYELMLLPRHHDHDFAGLGSSPENLVELATVLRNTMKCLEDAFGAFPYNLLIHTTPWEPGHEKYYHWHIEILPRLTIIAGFELGTGFYINPTAPEMAARELRGEQ